MGFADDHHVLIRVQDASAELLGQDVGMDVLELLTEPFQLRHPPRTSGRRGPRPPRLCLLLSDFVSQVDRSEPRFVPGVWRWSAAGRGALTPGESVSALRTTEAAKRSLETPEAGDAFTHMEDRPDDNHSRAAQQ